jgi:hypothetical protein
VPIALAASINRLHTGTSKEQCGDGQDFQEHNYYPPPLFLVFDCDVTESVELQNFATERPCLQSLSTA